MSIIVKQRERVHVEKFSLSFEWNDCPGAGFGFDCTREGTLLTDDLTPEARDNLRKCQDGTYEVTCTGITDYSYSYMEPAIGKCSCGREVVIEGFTSTCECGRDYNSSGYLLAPRSQWGEETGESLADILRIP